MKIVLYRPQIPQNTGNVVRTCAVTQNELLLVPPLGFLMSDRYLKRAGLDYWSEVPIDIIHDFEHFLDNCNAPFYFFSSKGTKRYTDIAFSHDSILVFGSETFGLPPHFFEHWPYSILTIPMVDGARCLNVSNAVAIVTYEAWRQQNFILPG